MPSQLIEALRIRERGLVRAIEDRIAEPGSVPGLIRRSDTLYARVRHELLYGAIRHAGRRVSSSWKVVLASALRPGDVFLDVGANVGRVTQAASWLVRDHGRVHAFEPSPIIAGRLRDRLRYLGIDNVTVNETALGARSGWATLHEYADGQGGSTSLRPGIRTDRRHDRETQVPVATVDRYVKAASVDGIRLIKIDVEGAELDVLRGAARTLEEHRPALFVEASRMTSAAFGHDLDELIGAIGTHGYETFSWRQRSLAPVRSAGDIPEDWHHDDLIGLLDSVHDDVLRKLRRLSESSD